MIIGISGLAGSGKDTVADVFVKEHGFTKIAFADPIKRFCAETFEFTEEQLWGPSEFRNKPDKRYNGLTPRHALQQLGTEFGRRCYKNIWVDYAIKTSKELLSSKYNRYSRTKGVYPITLGEREVDGSPTPTGVIISDVRFINEVNKIKDSGGIIIKINRDGAGLKGDAGNHESEREIAEIKKSINYTINNNDSLDQLKNEVKNIVNLYIK